MNSPHDSQTKGSVPFNYDLYRLLADNAFGSCDNLGENISALGADIGGLLIPGASGLGLGVRATKKTTNEAGIVREFATKSDQMFYRVFSGGNSVGGFVTAVKPKSSAFAREALALPRTNRADLVQEVLVPAGTRVRRSRAAPTRANKTFPNRRGGAEQFELLDRIPTGNFGLGRRLR
ncbi:MAG: hypothetical protein A6F71_03430 [Cycloclasticus sp. symbiont of Poecilosclerida sp. M]|nr:MAG: hypothetical protein A6F71_03430 [Cycloclasticus sp. symbiont of Poecilosclerida sp. M]